MKRIGVLGGTFDPPHNGHLAASVCAYQALSLDQLLVVPANTPWQKVGTRTVSDAADRLALAGLTWVGMSGIEVSTIELERGGNSYTVDTVDELLANGADAVYVVIGSDIAPALDTWHRAHDLRTSCTIVVYDRPGSAGGRPPAGFTWEVVAVPQLDISSTDIRARVAAGAPIDGLVPPLVADYIHSHHLYRHPDGARIQ